MPSVVSRPELITALGAEGSSAPTALIDQLLDRAEAELWGLLKQNLVATTYTNEKYDGTGTAYLTVDKRFVTSVSAAAIEGEAAITPGSTAQLRIAGRTLILVNGRIWTKGLPNNVTLTYAAGVTAGQFQTQLPDIWSGIFDGALLLWADLKTQKGGVASLAMLDSSVTYIPTEGALGKLRRSWGPLVARHRRIHRTAIAPGPAHTGLGIGWA